MSVYAIDMDGVLYPFTESFRELYEEIGNCVLATPNNRWCYLDELNPEIKSKVWKDPRLFNNGYEPYEGSVKLVEQLQKEYNEVYIVTSVGANPNITVPAKWSWLNRHFPGIKWDHFVTLAAKEYFDADVMIDDYHYNLMKWKLRHPSKVAIMPLRPWNRDHKEWFEKFVGRTVEDLEAASYDIGAGGNQMNYRQYQGMENPLVALGQQALGGSLYPEMQGYLR